MTYKIIAKGFSTDIIRWLQINVGKLLWSSPNIEWKGEGWHLMRANFSYPNSLYIISIDDPELATLTKITWT